MGNGAGRNALEVIVVGIVIIIVSIFLLLCETGIARGSRTVLRHILVGLERTIRGWVFSQVEGKGEALEWRKRAANREINKKRKMTTNRGKK